ncbi:MAG TPA: carbamoyltransferase C-terminal domain-containing protein [Pyrinomonadaceae bacterium]|nr:carbamoyltransferase C-terminal domain-containing protein [Pyrinomonadaceae bacterium]
MIILGLNCFHGDSSAALVRDGRVIAAAEEERFRRIKHWAGFPSQAIAYCMTEAGISLSEVDHIAINQNSRANLIGKLQYILAYRPDPCLVWNRWKNRLARINVASLLAQTFPASAFNGSFHAVEHHAAHLSSAFYVSPFERAVTVSIDGFGDFASAAWGFGDDTLIRIDGYIYFPHSLGIFYQALTQFLGFPNYGDEYKVMGLAPYGRPLFVDAMRQIVRLRSDGSYSLDLRFFKHHREHVSYQWDDGAPSIGDLFSSALEEVLGPRRKPDEPLNRRHHDIANSVQAIYESAFFNLLNALYARSGIPDLTLAGGCAMNSVANGKICRNTSFRRLYVQAAAGDAGGAIGAAYWVWHKLGGARSFVMDHAYWGPQFDTAAINTLLAQRQADIGQAGCMVEIVSDESELCRRAALAIADGKVIGWFQGRMEWGPRALGNRSILGDPRRANMKQLLNSKIKRRESFRPFAPSILDTHVSEWFEEDGDVPFMTQVFQIRLDKRKLIPAVTHVDGSGRLQTVSQRSNPRYHRLISSFCDQTGIPMILNTSFNENEPVVCEPIQALDCFLRTKMDMLIMGDTFITRINSPHAPKTL